jgi:hypothetical protein
MALLEREGAATVNKMGNATAWKQHSVRGVLSGTLQKRFGLAIVSTKSERGRVYRVITAPARTPAMDVDRLLSCDSESA